MLADKSAAPLPRSWQPPPITKCWNCPISRDFFCYGGVAPSKAQDTFEQNKDGITPTCPMWQQQKASLDADKEV